MNNKIGEVLVEDMGLENAENLASRYHRIKERAVERDSEQSLTLIVNRKGYLQHINASDNMNGVKPKMYQAE
jgi:hypothetical protein